MTTRHARAGWRPTVCERIDRVAVGASSPSCAAMRELLVSDALDVALPGDETIVDAHVVSCRACATTLVELQHIAACLGAAVPQIEPPAALRRRVIDATRRKSVADPAIAKNDANPSSGAANADH